VKEFSSSARVRSGDRPVLEDLPFTLDGVEYTLRAPKESQLAFLFASSAASRSSSDRVAAILDFLESALVSPGDEILRARLLDPNDDLDLDAIMEIMTWAMETWSGRPPTSANGSSPRRSTVGRPSKAITSGGSANHR
jgi:hypothetical protein